MTSLPTTPFLPAMIATGQDASASKSEAIK
jgi:hypothetical protein